MIHNHEVGGSGPPLATIKIRHLYFNNIGVFFYWPGLEFIINFINKKRYFLPDLRWFS